jgi:methionine-rich copper-binding protein CopC
MYSKFLIVLSSALLVSLLLMTGPLAWAHAYPAVSVPNNGTTVKEPPREVRINSPRASRIAFSQITVERTVKWSAREGVK